MKKKFNEEIFEVCPKCKSSNCTKGNFEGVLGCLECGLIIINGKINGNRELVCEMENKWKDQ